MKQIITSKTFWLTKEVIPDILYITEIKFLPTSIHKPKIQKDL